MTEPVKTQPEKTDQKHKIKVGGVEKELTISELIEAAQKGEDYQKKTTELAQKRKEIDEESKKLGEWKGIINQIDGDPKLRDVLTSTMRDYQSGKVPKSNTTDRNLKLIDKKMEEATDPEVKESLREARQMILEISESSELKEEINTLKNEISALRNNTMVSISDRVESQIKGLKSRFGNEVVEKYESEIRTGATKYPSFSGERLFRYYASDEDVKTAYLNEVKSEKEKEEKRKTDGSMTTTQTVHSRVEPAKDKRGKIDWGATLNKLKEQGRFSTKI